MPEPSVLDYLKDRLAFWRPARLHLSDFEQMMPAGVDVLEKAETPVVRDAELPGPFPAAGPAVHLPWRMLGGLVLALLAQLALEPPARSLIVGVPLYALAVGWMIRAVFKQEWKAAEIPTDERVDQPDIVRGAALIAAVSLTLLAYWMFGSGHFTWLNTPVWLLAIFFYFQAFWIPAEHSRLSLAKLAAKLRPADWRIRVTPMLVLWITAAGLIVFFRTSQLSQVPAEMVSDHAEKLLDVLDVSHGVTPVYFTRNTGREAFQFYWTALMAGLFKTGISFMSLKIGTVLAGLLTLPYMYLLGKESGNKWVGFFAVRSVRHCLLAEYIFTAGLTFPAVPALRSAYPVLPDPRAANGQPE